MNISKIYVVSNMKLFSEYIIMEADYREANKPIRDKLINIFYILKLSEIEKSSNKEISKSYKELKSKCNDAINLILKGKLQDILNSDFETVFKNNLNYNKNKDKFDKLTVDIQEKIKTFVDKLDGLSNKNESLNEAEEDYDIELTDKDKEWINNRKEEILLNNHTEDEEKLWTKWATLELHRKKYLDADAVVPKELSDLINKAHSKAVKLSKEKEDTKEAADAKIAYKKKKEKERENMVNDTINSFEKSLTKHDETNNSALVPNKQNIEKQQKEESSESSNDSNNIDKLKTELEKIKDVQFDDEDNNFYKIGLRLIDNYEAFKDTMSDDDKKKLDSKIDKLIEDINKLSTSETSDNKSDENTKNKDNKEETKQKEQVEQTETKVIESKFITELKKDIPELEKIEDDDLLNVFNKYVSEEDKKNPDGPEYLGLTILTLGAIILKSISTDNYKTHIQNITKKDEA